MRTEKLQLVAAGAVLLFALYAGGCAQGPTRVDAEISVCCEANFFHYKTYQVKVTDAPGFLEPYLQKGLASVIERKGLVATVDKPDLLIDLNFDQIFLTTESSEEDYFGDSVDPSVASRFMAAISVKVFANDTGQIVWAGRLSRIHHNSHGQPRGNDHKMQGIIDGFAVLFADYPTLLTDSGIDY